MKWNPNDWQGRNRKQVENNYKIGTFVFFVFFVLVIFGITYSILT